MLHELIYKLGVKLRSPELMKKYIFLKESEKWTLEELKAYQLKELKRIIEIAYNKSFFYKKLYDDVGVIPADINSLEDIKKLPSISKKDLIDNNNNIQNKDGYRKLFYSTTSGSTREPLAFYRNSNWDATTRAAQLRGYSWYGVKPWERNGYFWGFSFDIKKKIKTRFLDFLLNRFRLFSYNDNEITKFQKKLKKAVYIEGYSSMIYEVSKKINKISTWKSEKLKMVKGTSEKIYESYQSEVKKAFGMKMVSEYGSCETGIIAFECKFGNMHVAMEDVIVEEENGEIIVTNLVSDSFPIIRYKLGDSVKVDFHKKCECGMEHQIISEVVGRVGKVLYGKAQSYPSLTLNYIFKNMVMKYGVFFNYQAVQNEKGKLTINLEQEITENVKEKLIFECSNYFHDDIDITIVGNNLKRNYDGKFQNFISTVEQE